MPRSAWFRINLPFFVAVWVGIVMGVEAIAQLVAFACWVLFALACGLSLVMNNVVERMVKEAKQPKHSRLFEIGFDALILGILFTHQYFWPAMAYLFHAGVVQQTYHRLSLRLNQGVA